MTRGAGLNANHLILTLRSPVRVDACRARALGVAFLGVGASCLSLSDGIRAW